jgi:gluconolactonase
MTRIVALAGAALLAACTTVTDGGIATSTTYQQVGEIEVTDPALSTLMAPNVKGEILATGYKWSEGPVWIADKSIAGDGFILFSDVPGNIMYRWDAAGGASEYLNPSGSLPTPELREPGTNGLIPSSKQGHILAGDHGNRAIVEMNLATKEKTVIANRFNGKRFSSPNDLVLAKSGDLYFTDPPYGFAKGDASPLKEQPVNGVYRRTRDGAVTLIEVGLTRPNGIALSPDETKLYVANSDPARAIWMVYDRATDGSVSNGRVFYDATTMVGASNPGLPDGLKTDIDGNLFATGPGGLLIFSPAAKLLGIIRVSGPVANVTFGGPNRDILFLTAQSRLIRIKTKTKGYQDIGQR